MLLFASKCQPYMTKCKKSVVIMQKINFPDEILHNFQSGFSKSGFEHLTVLLQFSFTFFLVFSLFLCRSFIIPRRIMYFLFAVGCQPSSHRLQKIFSSGRFPKFDLLIGIFILNPHWSVSFRYQMGQPEK